MKTESQFIFTRTNTHAALKPPAGLGDAQKKQSVFFVLVGNRNRFEVIGLKNLAAAEAANVINAIAPGNNLGVAMVTEGLHTEAG